MYCSEERDLIYDNVDIFVLLSNKKNDNKDLDADNKHHRLLVLTDIFTAERNPYPRGYLLYIDATFHYFTFF